MSTFEIESAWIIKQYSKSTPFLSVQALFQAGILALLSMPMMAVLLTAGGIQSKIAAR
jgi:hypothetical protein